VHPVNYEVELGYLLDYVKEVVEFKGVQCEANIDSVGEVACYKQLIELIRGIRKIEGVSRISMQTNGTLLDGEKIFALEKAGLNRLNLSINAIDAELARKLSGTLTYDVEKIIELAKIVSDSGIELLLAPVWLPRLNDEEITKIIELAKKLDAKIGIQKYETYKYSRKAKGVKKISYWKFYQQLRKWEQQFSTKLICTAEDFGISKAKRLPTMFGIGEKVWLDVKCPGWVKGQMLAVGRDRCVSINNCNAVVGKKVKARIVENKNNIYIAEIC